MIRYIPLRQQIALPLTWTDRIAFLSIWVVFATNVSGGILAYYTEAWVQIILGAAGAGLMVLTHLMRMNAIVMRRELEDRIRALKQRHPEILPPDGDV